MEPPAVKVGALAAYLKSLSIHLQVETLYHLGCLESMQALHLSSRILLCSPLCMFWA